MEQTLIPEEWKTILIRTPEDEAAYSSKQSDVVDIIKKIEKDFLGCHITVLTRYKKQADLLKKKFSKSAQSKFQIVSKVVDGKKCCWILMFLLVLAGQ